MKQEIINECAKLFGVHPRDLVGNARFGFLMPARFALYKAFHLRGWSSARIGRNIGGRDHTTVLHGLKRADYIMERDASYARRVERLAAIKPKALDPACLPPERVPEPEPEPENELEAFLYD